MLIFNAGFSTSVHGGLRFVVGGTTINLDGFFAHETMSPARNYTPLADAVNAALVAAGITNVTIAYDATTNAYTWTRPFLAAIPIECGADNADENIARFGRATGFSTDPAFVGSPSGDVAPWYRIAGDLGAFTRSSGDYEGGGSLTEESYSESGRAYRISKIDAPTFHEFTVPFEPIASVYERKATTDAPWTWEHFFRHVRGVIPFRVEDDCDVRIMTLRADGTLFVPRRTREDWDARWDIQITGQVEGYL